MIEVLPRPSWDEYFMMGAVMLSSRGTCDRLRCGCVLTINNKLVSSGYNGSISGQPSCDEVGHLMHDGHCIRTIHAEKNAIISAKTDLTGAVAYCTAKPCIDCANGLAQAGIKRVVFPGIYTKYRGSDHVDTICGDAGVALDMFTDNATDMVGVLSKMIKRLEGPGGLFKEVDVVGTLEIQQLP